MPAWLGLPVCLYYAARPGNVGVVMVQALAGGAPRLVSKGRPGASFTPSDVSTDGRWLAGALGGAGQSLLAFMVIADGTMVPMSELGLAAPTFSPDGGWLAYALSTAGRHEIFVRTVPKEAGGPATPEKKQVSLEGGQFPVWRADGKEIVYRAPGGMLMSVAVDTSRGTLQLGKPTPLFPLDSTTTGFDLAADGSRILVNRPVADTSEPPVTVIVNWPTLLKK